MRKGAKPATLATGTTDAFFARSLARAKKLDRKEPLLPELRLTFEDPADLAKLLTTQRIRVLNALRKQPGAVAELATRLKRDRTAIKRDVKILSSFGLVRIHVVPNPGHGRRKIIEPLASRFELTAIL